MELIQLSQSEADNIFDKIRIIQTAMILKPFSLTYTDSKSPVDTGKMRPSVEIPKPQSEPDLETMKDEIGLEWN